MAFNRASAGYRGTGKTDAKDATVVADQARMRRDLTDLRPDDEHAVELRVRTGLRSNLVADRTRTLNRLRTSLTSIFPALERALELSNLGPLVLLTGYQTPAALRRVGTRRLTTWLGNSKVRGVRALAEAAIDAAERQHTALPGELCVKRGPADCRSRRQSPPAAESRLGRATRCDKTPHVAESRSWCLVVLLASPGPLGAGCRASW